MKIIIPAIILTTITMGGFKLQTKDILASAQVAAVSMQRRELRTALEFYYLDHDAYPQTTDFNELVKVLYEKGYIEGAYLPGHYIYTPLNNGQDYKLEVLD